MPASGSWAGRAVELGPPLVSRHRGSCPASSLACQPMPDPPLLVSACLLGVRCNHRGEASPSPSVVALAVTHRLIPICPETAGGLATPRPAAEVEATGRFRPAPGRT